MYTYYYCIIHSCMYTFILYSIRPYSTTTKYTLSFKFTFTKYIQT